MTMGTSSICSFFPADTAVLSQIGEMVSNAGKNAGFNSEEIGAIQLAVDEACTNTICHGLKHDASKKFKININWSNGQIEIVIQETGEPFDLKQVKPPDITSRLEERSIGGLGLFFIKKLMDEVDYLVGKEGIKTFRMIKKKRII